MLDISTTLLSIYYYINDEAFVVNIRKHYICCNMIQ